MGAPATISQVGAMVPANNNTGFCTGITLNPTNVGDIVALMIELKYSAASNRTITGISGTGITWQGTATFQHFMADGIHSVEVWYGTVTATGSHLHTVAYSSTTGQVAGSINAHQLTSTAGTSTVWAVDKTGFNDPNVNGTTFPYPTLTSALDKECYIGYLAITGSASAGSGTGWVYEQDLRGNWDAHNNNVGIAGTAATTSQSSGSSQLWFTVGVLFQASTAAVAHPLAATGLASTSGSFGLPLLEPLSATGLASTSGSADLPIRRTLAASALATTTGSAIFSTPLAATGLASTTGTAGFVVVRSISAIGLAATTGSGNLIFVWTLAATAKASTTGSATIFGQLLSATGLAATTGSTALGIKRALQATGLAATTGAMALIVRRVLAAVGKASTSGSFAMLRGKLPDPFGTPVFAPTPPMLGCGTWRVFIATRGGGQLLAELDYESLSLQRRLNDVSAATVSVMAAKNVGCLPVLADVEPFQHEIVAYRDYRPGDDPAWAGPVTVPVWDPLSLSIAGRDLFTWLERRTLPIDRSFTDEDLADIFAQYLGDALSLDRSMNLNTIFAGQVGTLATRAMLASSFTYAGDALRELSRSGVDFTLVGRDLRYGGLPLNNPSAVFYDPAIWQDPGGSSPKLTKQGLNMATVMTVKGGQDANLVQIVSTDGYPDARHGLIAQVVSEPLILDPQSASRNGFDRLTFLNPAPLYLSVILSRAAPIRFSELIPGIRIDTAFSLGLRTVEGPYRLQAVDVTASTNAEETVALTLVPLVT